MGQIFGADCDLCGVLIDEAEQAPGVIARHTFGPLPSVAADFDFQEPGPDVPPGAWQALRLGPDPSRVPGRLELCMACEAAHVSYSEIVLEMLDAHRHDDIKRREKLARLEAEE